MSITSQLQKIKASLPAQVTLVAVSKMHPAPVIREAYAAGQRVFGESRPQELAQKAAELPADIQWHFIGHLQTNKVKQVVSIAQLIHSVDSERLLLEIAKEAAKKQCTARCLLQIHIAQEETKFGFSPDELRQLLASPVLKENPQVTIAGLMGMATFTDNQEQIHQEFHTLKQLFDEVKARFFPSLPTFCELSMGMSGDYQIAIAEGSTMVRIGTDIFGVR